MGKWAVRDPDISLFSFLPNYFVDTLHTIPCTRIIVSIFAIVRKITWTTLFNPYHSIHIISIIQCRFNITRCINIVLGWFLYTDSWETLLGKVYWFSQSFCEPWAVQGLMTYLILSASFVRQRYRRCCQCYTWSGATLSHLWNQPERCYKMHGSLSTQHKICPICTGGS